MAKKQQSYEEMFMKVNPLQLGGAGKGKSKDIHLTNIDVSFGSNRILCVFERTGPCCSDFYLSALQQVGSRSYDGAREALRVSQPD